MPGQVARALIASRFLPSRVRARLYRCTGLVVDHGARIMPGVTFRPGLVRIGARVFVNQDCVIDPGPASVTIEDGVALGPRVMLLAASHEPGTPVMRAGAVTGAPIVVGEGSWIGAGAVVLAGVCIGRGCVIGAGAVVVRDTDPDGVYAGVPARRIRDLP
ncbi:MAG: maltose O-acetyltransferase [Actinomycetota bacterium]|nr:maltose O-acetyltransferase [Actinomycetota bacterium]